MLQSRSNRIRCRSSSLLILSSLSLLLLSLISFTPTPIRGQWFTDPCSYHPHSLHQLRLRFESIIGQKYATDNIYSHLQRHLESYESWKLHKNDPDFASTPQKPLVLSFHGPTGTGKSLTANSIASALFHNARSSHIHTYHGADFSGSTPEQVEESINFLKQEFSSHVKRCSLSLFIIEEIHLIAPGVLDSLRHLMDTQAPNSRFKIPNTPTKMGGGGTAGQAASQSADEADTKQVTSNTDSINDVDASDSAPLTVSSSSSVALNFAHVIWLFTTNIGSQQVQKIAYDAAKSGLPRESLSPKALHDILLTSLQYEQQLKILRDSSVLSALIPFFPLFKQHVKECAQVQLNFRKKYWLQNGQLNSFEYDSSVPAYASSQLKYSGPISIYGCKNIHEILTTTLLSPLTRKFRKIQEEDDYLLSEIMKDTRIPKRKKLWEWSMNLVKKASQLFTGTIWNYGKINVTMKIEQNHISGGEEIVFELEQVITPATGDQQAIIEKSEIRHPLQISSQFHSVQETHTPSKHDHIVDAPTTPTLDAATATTKDEL